MTNQSLRATFGNKYISRSDLDHPTRLGTPRGSNMLETLVSPTCQVARHYGTSEESLAPEFARIIASWDPFQN